MTALNNPFQAFTVRAPGIASQLTSAVSISLGYDPSAPPDPLPLRHDAVALWDTGATRSVISPAVVSALGLVPVGAVEVSHAGGLSTSPQYIVNFGLPNSVTVVGVLVTEFPGLGGFDAIIGMDIISIGDFSVTHVDGKTCMSFRTPSLREIDYVAEHRSWLKAAVGRNAPCPCGKTDAGGKPIKFKYCHGK